MVLLTINVTDVAEVPDVANLPSGVSLAEDLVGVISIFNVSASDPDGDTLSYNLSSTPAGAPFTVTTTTGEIFTAAAPGLDHESTPTYILHIEVSDSVLSHVGNLTVNITDVNEMPVFNETNIQEVVVESETAAVVIHKMFGIDEDVSDSLVYSINSTVPPGAPFSCDSSTGETKVTTVLSERSLSMNVRQVSHRF